MMDFATKTLEFSGCNFSTAEKYNIPHPNKYFVEFIKF